MRSSPPWSIVLFVGSLLAGCSGSRRLPSATAAPAALALTLRPNVTNVLSVSVGFDSLDMASAWVRVRGGGEEMATPKTTLNDGPQEILVLGLLPETDYSLELMALSGDGRTVAWPPLAYRTPALPPFLATSVAVRALGTSSGGYTLTNVTPQDRARHYLFAFDDRGLVRWYRHLPGLGAFTEQLPNGNYGAFVGFTTGFQADPEGHFVELTPGGVVVRRHRATGPYFTDNHELLLTPAPGGWATHYFTYDIRVVDTTRIGGRRNTNLAGHQIRRFRPDGRPDFLWDAWNHFVLEDWIEEPAIERTHPDADFDHPNSLTLDHDGNYIVSWRNLAEVTKIDARTGRIVWRFGGRNNQFTIRNDPLHDLDRGDFAFCGQHSVQVTPAGTILIYDNGLRHRPPQSRAVEYRLDLAARTATMVWEFRHTPSLYTPFTGSVERLANGNTNVGFAQWGAVVEVDPAGRVLFEAAVVVDGQSASTYRLKRIQSLYGPVR